MAMRTMNRIEPPYEVFGGRRDGELQVRITR